MLRRFFSHMAIDDFVVIDHQFPQKDPFAFKNAEINEYFSKIPSFKSYTMHPMRPGPDAWFSHGYGISYREFLRNRKGYLKHYDQDKGRIKYLFPNRQYRFRLAYTYFLAETYVLLPFLENNRIPFVFVLYPGGGFGLNNNSSDAMLKKIFASEMFRGVITTQAVTDDYLVSKRLCDQSKIHHIYGGFVQFKKDAIKPKLKYKKSKQTFDICFVAARYSEKGVDKGYDLFIETAKKIRQMSDDVRFHVLGGFDESDIDVTDLKDRIHFYGYKKPEFLVDFYSKMDIFLAPSRPFQLFEGNFDGFPLGIDAGYCGVAIFVSDELKMNRHYTNGKDIVIIDLDVDKIVDKVMRYYNDPDALYELSSSCQIKTQELFDIDTQISSRVKVFNNILEGE